MTTSNPPSSPGIAIIAPGGYAPDEAALGSAMARLEALGFSVHNYVEPAKKHQRFGASDRERLAQLHAAAGNQDAQIVLALRGGYGMSRLLGDIDYGLLAASGKLFVGHSDFTALQMALLAQAGAPSFAGPMICDDFARAEPSDFTLRHFMGCITAPEYTVVMDAADNPALDVSGMLWGGNLAMLTHLAGTPYLPEVEGGILFIEDINEHPYRVERMLLQLYHAGVLQRQQALLLGDFSAYRLSDYDNGYDFKAMLDYLRGKLSLPVLTGLPFGHIRDKVTLAVGSQARLQSDDAGCSLRMRGYPFLAEPGRLG
jgi:muramoyltetrapeptide carboxypeptidase